MSTIGFTEGGHLSTDLNVGIGKLRVSANRQGIEKLIATISGQQPAASSHPIFQKAAMPMTGLKVQPP